MKSRIIASALLLATPILQGAYGEKKLHEESAYISREVLRMFDKGDDIIIKWIAESPAHKNAVQNVQSDGTTLLMLSIELGKKKVIDYLLDNGANTRALTKQKDDALDSLIYTSGLKTTEENIAVATKLIDLMITQGANVDQLLQRLAALNKDLHNKAGELKKKIEDYSFFTNGTYKDKLKRVNKTLSIIDAIIKHLAQKETVRRASIKK